MRKVGRWYQITKKKAVCFVVAAAGIGVMALGFYLREGLQGKRVDARETPIQEAQAQIGTISDTIVGTGNLQYEEGVSVTIPSGIVVDEVNVEENDIVSKGDVLAVVNKVSVLSALEDIQEELDELDEQIDDSKDDTDSQSITAKTDGTIKKIYVQEGQDIADCMMEQGALLLLSIDGGSDEEEELAITAASGIVEEICVSEGEEVYAGTTLLEVASAGRSLAYQEQIARRKELTQNLQELIALSKSGVITAQADGIIQSVNISAEGGTDEAEEMSDAQSEAALVGKTETSGYITTAAGCANISKKAVALVGSAELSNRTATVVSSTGTSRQIVTAAGSAQSVAVSDATAESVQETQQEAANEEKILTLKIQDSGTSNQGILAVESPRTGSTPQTVLCAEDGSYQGQISWKPGDGKFAADTSYQAYVTLAAGEGYLFADSSIAQVKTGVLSGVSVGSNGKEMSFCITYPFTTAENQDSQEEEEDKDIKETAQKDNDGGENTRSEENNAQNGGKAGTDNKDEKAEPEGNNGGNGAVIGDNAESGNFAANGSRTVSLAAGNTSSSQTASQGSGQSDDEKNMDANSEITAFTIAASDTMRLSVNVDELDINSVSQGQQAEVTLDAIENETFTGTVTKVGSSAGSSGGVAKYAVEVEISGDERMKVGMNASATITVKKQEDVVTIPVTALQERGAKVFVYTQADSDGNLGGEQEVSTGLSDGSTVEITEGLSEGDKVYYQRVGNVSGEKNFQGFGNMEERFKDGMGEMPGGGEMPEGGMPGGGKMPGGGAPFNQQ